MSIVELVNPDALGPIIASVTEDSRWLSLDAKLIAGGKSNLTFEVTSEAGTVILRRPPNGTILPSAHDMVREARVQRALASTNIPVARVLYLDATDEHLGVPFYIMEKVPGHVIRDALPDHFAESDGDKVALGNTLIDVLLELHSIVPTAISLGNFGRPEGYLERQLRRWSDQWAKTKTEDVEAIDELIVRLKKRIPESSRSTIVHGDYRLDNCIVSAEDPSKINAVLDWELSSLGDPMLDLALTLFYWREPGDVELTLIPSVTATPGFPRRSHLANRYSASSQFHFDDLSFYEAFARFKYAVIAQGVLSRVVTNAMAGQDFGNIKIEVRDIAEEGLSKMDGRR